MALTATSIFLTVKALSVCSAFTFIKNMKHKIKYIEYVIKFLIDGISGITVIKSQKKLCVVDGISIFIDSLRSNGIYTEDVEIYEFYKIRNYFQKLYGELGRFLVGW
jgi:hypothetical protein